MMKRVLMINLYSCSWWLRNRQLSIMEGLEDHVRGRYGPAIRMLLPEVEGVLGDIQVIQRKVAREKYRLYLLDQTGRRRKDTNSNKDLRVAGLDQLIDGSGFKGHPELAPTYTLIKDEIAPDHRNPILHGRRVSFREAKLSTQLVLLLWVLGKHLIAVETAKKQTKR